MRTMAFHIAQKRSLIVRANTDMMINRSGCCSLAEAHIIDASPPTDAVCKTGKVGGIVEMSCYKDRGRESPPDRFDYYAPTVRVST